MREPLEREAKLKKPVLGGTLIKFSEKTDAKEQLGFQNASEQQTESVNGPTISQYGDSIYDPSDENEKILESAGRDYQKLFSYSKKQQAPPEIKKLGYQPYKISDYRFQDEIRTLMYAFGDDIDPDEESVELMEGYLVEYVSNLVNRVHNRSQRAGSHNMQLGDLIHYLKQNEAVYYRVPFILEMNKKVDRKKLN